MRQADDDDDHKADLKFCGTTPNHRQKRHEARSMTRSGAELS